MFEWWLENIKEISREEYEDMSYWLQMQLLEEYQEDYTSTYHLDGYYRMDCGDIYQILIQR